MTSAVQSGREAEDFALEFLRHHGLKLVARNFRCRAGEIDLILKDNSELVVTEVRLRSSPGFGDAVESVTAKKRRRIILATLAFTSSKPEYREVPIRFDVVAIDKQADGLRARWLKDAFRADEK